MSVLFDEDTIRRIYVEELVAKEREAEKREIAREMLKAGEPRTKIMQFTKLSDKELNELQFDLS